MYFSLQHEPKIIQVMICSGMRQGWEKEWMLSEKTFIRDMCYTVLIFTSLARMLSSMCFKYSFCWTVNYRGELSKYIVDLITY